MNKGQIETINFLLLISFMGYAAIRFSTLNDIKQSELPVFVGVAILREASLVTFLTLRWQVFKSLYEASGGYGYIRVARKEKTVLGLESAQQPMLSGGSVIALQADASATASRDDASAEKTCPSFFRIPELTTNPRSTLLLVTGLSVSQMVLSILALVEQQKLSETDIKKWVMVAQSVLLMVESIVGGLAVCFQCFRAS